MVSWSVLEPGGKVDLIASIFSVKNVANLSANDLSESQSGSTGSLDLCRVLSSTCHSLRGFSLFFSICSEIYLLFALVTSLL